MLNDLKKRMEGALSVFNQDMNGLRTGRASADLLAPVTVMAYGSRTPVNQVGNINVPDSRTITVQVWDKNLLGAVEQGIRDAGLGLNPSSNGDVIHIPLPDLNEERRKELVKVAGKYAETSRVAIRNVRRDGMDDMKKQQKDGSISEDEARGLSDKIQKLTDDMIAQVDAALTQKEKDILTV